MPTIVLSQPKTGENYENIGRTATANEVKAWDIDVRPDFKGLPKGMGSVRQGEVLWEAQCASCHGSFGENNTIFSPLAGYTTKKDVETGRVASLLESAATPTRTTMMKVSQVSTLWDYINRAMPWTAPKSLSANEVYALTAYMLNLGNVVPEDFTLSDKNIAEVQKKMPNRFGMTIDHAMWPGPEFGTGAKDFKGAAKPDTQGSSCMSNCNVDPKVASFIPDYARNAHGNLVDQNRGFGSSRGTKTVLASVSIASVAPKNVVNSEKPVSPILKSTDISATLNKYACLACHGIDTKLVGPSFKEIVSKQAGRADASAYLAGKIKNGSSGVYGSIPMPAQNLSEGELSDVVKWIVSGAAK